MSGKVGLSVNIEGLGYVQSRKAKPLHAVKSVAGRVFHQPFVKSVCVFTEDGVSHLYLKKTPTGVYREVE